MSNATFLELIIEVMKRILNKTYQNTKELSSGRVLEISQVLDELIVAYRKL